MYDGLSKNDLRIILAHQAYSSARWGMSVSQAMNEAEMFLRNVEALNAEQERSDGEGSGTRA